MFELYHSPYSTCSQKVRLCLAEKGLAYVSREINLQQREQLDPAYLGINPDGVVPTLVHDGTAIPDSSVICEYLDEVAPQPALSPQTAAGRAAMRAWMRYIEEVPTAAIRAPTFNRLLRHQFEKMSPEQVEAYAARSPLRKHALLNLASRGPQLTGEAEERLQQTLERAESALTKHAWLAGAALTLADVTLLPIIVRMDDLGLLPEAARHPKVAGWYARLQARPSFPIAYYAGTRLGAPATRA